ncbi:phosphoenolpyruvate--protein phosphotransferase [Phenylobacterium sp.]|uniref:phosphoenolpyruvate--protein phosphotransferase n=1 Tax=Phenylobacterium sp. TaxID=1871053 RepID=UPI003564D9CA
MTTLKLLAPVAGWAAPLAEVPDPVFAGGMIGDGIAIDPTGEAIVAPCDGEVIKVHHARHAVTLRATGGAEILIHIGLDTVALGGEGFEVHVQDGQAVRTGDRLISFDLDRLARAAPSVMTPIVLTNTDAFAIAWRRPAGEVVAGEPILELTPLADAAAAPGQAQAEALSRRLRITHAHGLHARPAALIATEVKRRAATVEMSLGGRTANARNMVALMSLGVRAGDEVMLTARGRDAEAALAALADIVERQINGAPAPVEVHAPPSAAPANAGPGVIAGVRAAPGFAMGVAAHLTAAPVRVDETSAGVAEETAKFDAAVAAVAVRLKTRAAALGGDRRAVLEAHVSMLEDEELLTATRGTIASGASAGVAWRDIVGRSVETLQGLGDARLAERAADLTDLQRQVLLELSGDRAAAVELPPGAILLADDLMPSDLIGLEAAQIAGLCTARGGPTSHVAVIAAAMGIPAVVAAGPGVLVTQAGRRVILDGDAGLLIAAPDAAQVKAAKARIAAQGARKALVGAAAMEPCVTLDGVRIEVRGNVGSPAEARAAAENGAEGCGLLRTEFLFLDRQTAPDEAEQTRQYQAVADALAGLPVVVRTLDVGGDKPAPYLALPAEENPALGLRGVRVSLSRPELLKTQVRAILGVRPAGQCRIMVPMVASLSELLAVRVLVDEVRAELGLDAPVALGVMIETPAAAVTADLIAAHADFLSIGTNDLAQYALAMDRGNPTLAGQVDALHPAVLRLIGQAAEGARAKGRPVAVCGGLASDLAAVPILIGLGVTELSAAPAMIPEVKALIRTLDAAACRDLAARACAETSAAAVRALTANLQDPTPPVLGAASCPAPSA